MNKIKIIDVIYGNGKTEWMMQHICELSKENKVIYVVPSIEEARRIKKSCTGKYFRIIDPLEQTSEFNHFLKSNQNICLVDNFLFCGFDDETLQLIKERHYILVMDDVMDVIKPLDMYPDYTDHSEEEKQRICRKDMKIFESKNFVDIDSSYLVKWIEQKNVLNRYKYFKEIIEKGSIYFPDKTLLFETFPSKIFKEDIFKEIYILTYQFEYQPISHFFRYFNIPYEKFGVKKHRMAANRKYNFSLVTYDENLLFDSEMRERFKSKIKIVTSERLNEVGTKNSESNIEKLSIRHYHDMTDEEIKSIQSKTLSFISDKMCNETSRVMWTTFDDDKDKFLHKRLVKKSFVPVDCRATNDYRNRDGLVYLANLFPDPCYDIFFAAKGIRIDQDMYALNKMLQWIFRSAIRDEKPIDIFIPSERMRGLLEEWLDGKY